MVEGRFEIDVMYTVNFHHQDYEEDLDMENKMHKGFM